MSNKRQERGRNSPLLFSLKKGRKTMSKNKWTQVLDELDKCGKLMSVWAILKCGEFVGRVTARYSKSGGTTYVTFQMFICASSSGSVQGVYGYERMSGWGYNRTEGGIAEILNQNRESLKEECGIELTGYDWEIQGRWKKGVEAAGYKVVRVI